MSIFRKLIGFLLIVAAIGGLVFSITGLVFVFRVEARVTKGLQDSVDLLSQTLATTAQGLTVTESALKGSVDTIRSLQSTVETTALTIKTSKPMVDEISKVMTDDLPQTIRSTQSSLNTAQESARVIDSVLSTLSSIPLIGSSIGYNPEVPLAQALGEVANSLTNLPDSFANMAESLQESSSNLENFHADLTVMAASIGEIENSVAQYDDVVKGYQTSIGSLNTRMAELKVNLPNIVHTVMLGLMIFFIWMTIVQFGLFSQGWELIFETRPSRKKEAAEKAAE